MSGKGAMDNPDENTIRYIAQTLAYQSGISPELAQDVISVLKGDKIAVEKNQIPGSLSPLEPLIRPAEAAKLLGMTKKGVAYHAEQGHIRVVRIGDRVNGYVAADIRSLLNGERLRN